MKKKDKSSKVNIKLKEPNKVKIKTLSAERRKKPIIERNKNESLYSMNKTHQTEYLYEDNKKSKKDLKSNQTISNDKTKAKQVKATKKDKPINTKIKTEIVSPKKKVNKVAKTDKVTNKKENKKESTENITKK